MLATIIYVVCYILKLGFIKMFFGDMTIFLCLMGMFIWESYIQTGMISVNSKYAELMEASEGIAFQIYDENKQMRFESRNCAAVPSEKLYEALEHPVMIENNIRLSHSDIKSGHVFWQEDMSEIIEINEKLSETRKMLEDEMLVAREKYSTDLLRHRLEERNRLYDKIQSDTRHQIAIIMKMIERCEDNTGEGELRNMLVKMTIIGAYLKRRSNLLIMADSSDTIHTSDLEKCFEESLSNIKMTGAVCVLRMELPENIKADTAIGLYDFFEENVEKVDGGLVESVFIRLYRENNMIAIRIAVETETRLSTVVDDDGVQILSCYIREEAAEC